MERAISSHGAKQTCSYCGRCNKNWILFHFSKIRRDQKPQSQLFSLLFDFNSDLREPHNLSPNSLSPLDCPVLYILYRCWEYKSHPILSHLELLLPNHFSEEAKRTHFLQGGKRSWQQTTQASSCSSCSNFGGLSEAVTGLQQNSCIPQSSLLANRQSLFTKCRESFTDWNLIHCFLTFAPFFSISHMETQASPVYNCFFDLCTRKSVSSQLHISREIKFALVVHLKPDRSPLCVLWSKIPNQQNPTAHL